MDAKVLAAVLASLAAVFAGTNGGMFSTSDVRDVASEAPGVSTPSANSLLQDAPVIGGYFKKPEPTNDIKAKISVKGPAQLQINNAKLEAQELTRIDSRTMKIGSDENILFKQFNGKVDFGNRSKLQGSSEGLSSSGVNLTTRLNLDTEVETPQIDVENTQKTAMNFRRASISPTENSDFPLNTEESKLDVNSFTGDMTIYPANSTLIIQGKVATVDAGKTSYGE